MSAQGKKFDAFLSHSHEDAEWVENLARRLEDQCGFRIWLDRWILVPGTGWQEGMTKGLGQAAVCAACVGARPPYGWFKNEIERALEIGAIDRGFRVIPVLLPDANPDQFPGFLSLGTWVDFRNGKDYERAFHALKQGIKGEPPGRWSPQDQAAQQGMLRKYEEQILQLHKFSTLGLHEETVIEYERKILDKWLEEGKG